MSIAKAIDDLKTAMLEDPSYAWSWHCNIAVPAMDWAGLSHEQANRLAAKLMDHLFDVDTSKHEHFAYKDKAA